jgi:hypothetical protein
LRWARASSRVGLRATHVPHRATFPAGVGSCSAVRFDIEQYRQLSLEHVRVTRRGSSRTGAA